MNYFTQILNENPLMFFITIILFIYAAREAHNLYKWIDGLLDSHHKRESSKEDVTEQISNIACVSQEHTKNLSELTQAINELSHDMKDMKSEINKKFEDAERERKADTVAMARAELYDLYENLKGCDSITLRQHETFLDLASRYEANGGNGTMAKLVEVVKQLPIKENWQI